jgi:Uma2 family endonuclease
MTIRPKFAPHQQMTVEEFLAFTDTRPDDERWELIEGVPVLNASPTDFHQVICGNILSYLLVHKAAHHSSWLPVLGIGTRVPASPQSLPQPDVFVLEGAPTGRPETEDALVLFEVLSKSNTKADQLWRRRVYASIPNCQHYVTVSLKRAEMVAYDRASGWEPRKALGLTASLELASLGVTLPLASAYRYTPIGQD